LSQSTTWCIVAADIITTAEAALYRYVANKHPEGCGDEFVAAEQRRLAVEAGRLWFADVQRLSPV
jgi:hypothetical protein